MHDSSPRGHSTHAFAVIAGLVIALVLMFQPADAALACFGSCGTERHACESTLGSKANCGTGESLCRERCDPARLAPSSQRYENRILARSVSLAQREVPEQRARICSQDCDLTARSCVVAGNRSELCQQGRQACRARCDGFETLN